MIQEKIKVPPFVADVIKEYKEKDKGLYDLTVLTTNSDYNEWFLDDNDNQTAADKFELVAEAWVNGYEVEKEKKYIVRFSGFKKGHDVLNKKTIEDEWCLWDDLGVGPTRISHTKEELENAGFGWVFEAGFAREIED